MEGINRLRHATKCPTNLLIRPLHANLFNSTENLASNGTEVWFRSTEAW